MNLSFVLFFLLHVVSPQSSEANDPNSILRKINKELNNIETLKYDLERELNYPDQDYLYLSYWNCFYDFSLENGPIGFRYQIEGNTPKLKNSAGKSIYNGSEKFELKKVAKSLEILESPGKKDFEGQSFFYNSLITLRSALTFLIEDKNVIKSIEDLRVEGQMFKVVTANIGKRRIQPLGDGIDIMQTKYNIIYKIVIDPARNLPVEVIQVNDANDDFIRTSFTNIELNPGTPEEDTWYYSSYITDYKRVEKKDIKKPLAVGSIAPDWTLKVHNESEKLSFADLKGKVVLLEFWIKSCGHCISSVSYLNKLHETIDSSDFELISLNAYDSKESIQKFIEKHDVKYPVLLDGKDLESDFGVDAYPTIFLINRSGKIIYSQNGLDETSTLELEKMIRKAL